MRMWTSCDSFSLHALFVFLQSYQMHITRPSVFFMHLLASQDLVHELCFPKCADCLCSMYTKPLTHSSS